VRCPPSGAESSKAVLGLRDGVDERGTVEARRVSRSQIRRASRALTARPISGVAPA
jgi:hypothetical protein